MSIFVLLKRLEALLPPLDDSERVHNITGLGAILGPLYGQKVIFGTEKAVMPVIQKTILNKKLKLHDPKSRDTELIALAHALGENPSFFAKDIEAATAPYFVYFFNQLEDSARAKEFITEENEHFNKAQLDSQINGALTLLKEKLTHAPLRAEQKKFNDNMPEITAPTEILKFLNICLLSGYSIPNEDDFLASLKQHWQEFEACRPVIIELISTFLSRKPIEPVRKPTIEPEFLSKVIRSAHWQEFINNISKEDPQEYIELFNRLKAIFYEEGTPPVTCLPTEPPKEGDVRTFLIDQITGILNPQRWTVGAPVIAFNGINDFMRRFLSWNIPINLSYNSSFIDALKIMRLDTLYLEKLEYIFDKTPPSPFHSPSGLSPYEATLEAIETAWKEFPSIILHPRNDPRDTISKYLEYAEAFSRIADLQHLLIDEKLIQDDIKNKGVFIGALSSLKEPLKTKLYPFIANNSSAKPLLAIITDLAKEDYSAQNILKAINREKNKG